MSRGPDWWDNWFLGLARYAATASKDPSTQTGAVLVSPDRNQVVLGYNGFPRDIADDERLHNREVKYDIILHAEHNAILNAKRPLDGYTLYVHPLLPCSRYHCASVVIQSGIVRVVSLALTPELDARWGETLVLSRQLFAEAGVEILEVARADRSAA